MHNLHDIKEAAELVISEILSETTYMFLDPLEDKDIPEPAQWDCIGVTLAFKGKVSGEISLWTEKKFCLQATSNILGEEVVDNTIGSRHIDTLKEVLNIIVGNLLTKIFGDESVFDLGLPQLLPEKALSKHTQKSQRLWFRVEDSFLLITLDGLQ